MRTSIYLTLILLLLLPAFVAALVPGFGILIAIVGYPGRIILATLVVVTLCDVYSLTEKRKSTRTLKTIFQSEEGKSTESRSQEFTVAQTSWLATVVVVALLFLVLSVLAGHLARV